MKAWAAYAAASGVFLAVAGLALAAVVPGTATAIWIAAAVAYGVQLVAFAVLVAGRRTPGGFMLGWGGGMLLRLAAVAVFGIWLVRAGGYAPAPALVSLVGFVFVLVLIEPIFLRIGQ